MKMIGQSSTSLRSSRTGSGSQEGSNRTSHMFKDSDLQDGELQVVVHTHICF